MRILHVEDDEDTRKLVECILQGKGWQVVSVEDATSALELAAAGGFNLYLIDNWIEGDTENALCRGLRTLDKSHPQITQILFCVICGFVLLSSFLWWVAARASKRTAQPDVLCVHRPRQNSGSESLKKLERRSLHQHLH